MEERARMPAVMLGIVQGIMAAMLDVEWRCPHLN
ncbi:hypothetical protein CRT38_00465 [Anaplasma phagocytophilum str. CRT38]|uniref:Uncharacterized protein n=1 Tax=Anaplasma phagocytophilum str. CRT38 TaxID=1269275 RepID=S6GB92_ANAPH|nr:hypothetical protein CRT38_00465 [Anaplasma phagocytophilum str. CRT38]